MKLTRLSLAAIVAVGALGSFASATPLEEAIKGVDVTGFARLRYTHFTENPKVGDDVTKETIRISGELNVVAPIADGLAFGTTLTTEGDNNPDTAASAPTGDLGGRSFNFDKYYFLYSGVKDLAVIGGKYTIPAPWAESGYNGDRGNGLVALYSGVPNWTFAGALYLQTNGFDLGAIEGVLAGLDSKEYVDIDGNYIGTDAILGQRNLYALGAIGKAGPVDLQVWAASLEKIIDYTVYAQAAFELSGFNAKAQVNYLKLGDQPIVVDYVPNPTPPPYINVPEIVPLSKVFDDDAGLFYGIEAGYKNDLFFASAGYTQTDKDQPIYALDSDNDGFIKFGQQLYYKTTNEFDVATYFIKGGVTVDKFGAELGYGAASLDKDKLDYSEIYGLVSYQFAPKFAVQLYYSYLDLDDAGDNSEVQLELKYAF
ncbi:MAG: major outer membrane protein [Campylobacteraceae bacterium]|jgi:hypothetical protein|nr:major outer membrane protein [Campylobacteraceae bacterium]